MFVSNSSTLILLGKVNVLTKLLDDVKKIAIPKIVYEEIKKKDSFEVLLIKKAVEEERIEVLDVDEKEYENVLKEFKLDDGEAAAYALFKKTDGEAILTDDGELIKLCKINDIAFLIAMAVVIRLFKKKKLDKDESIEKLDRLYGYGRYSEGIYQFFKSEVLKKQRIN